MNEHSKWQTQRRDVCIFFQKAGRRKSEIAIYEREELYKMYEEELLGKMLKDFVKVVSITYKIDFDFVLGKFFDLYLEIFKNLEFG